MIGNICVACGIPKITVVSVAEAELGALFPKMKEGRIIHLVLK